MRDFFAHLGAVFYTRRTAWITIGIVLAVMVPLIMCIVCGVYCFRKRKLKEDPDWRMPIPSRSGSRTTLRNLASDGSEYDDHTIKKVRRYDATYDTHEPLAGKPDIQFEPKKMDLDEEDITSSEGGEYRDKVVNDFQYKNMADHKQLGRRRLTSRPEDDAGAGPSMFSGDTYPPPPTESPTPQAYGAYSPTFSGIDRNSSFATEDNSPVNERRPGGFPQQPTSTTGTFFSGGGGEQPNEPLNQNVGLPQRMDSRSTEV